MKIFTKNDIAKGSKGIYNNCILTEGTGNMRIAICDDQEIHRSQMKDSIDRLNDMLQVETMDEFESGEDLVVAHSNNRYNVIFLDIEMSGKSGLKIGEIIREQDNKVIIVIVTSHEHYMQQAFAVEVLAYITKPYIDSDVKEVLEKVLKKYRRQYYSICILGDNASRVIIAIDDIVYIGAHGKKVDIETKNNTFTCTGTIKKYTDELSNLGFFRCHERYLVNLNYVASIDKDNKLKTSTGDSIEVSQRKRKDFLDALADNALNRTVK